MTRKYELITELYERTQKSVTDPSKWQEFLSSACQNYKLPFDEQLLTTQIGRASCRERV